MRPTAQQMAVDRLRARMGHAIERMIAALDALDGDGDLEAECEDEGAACQDEGSDSDTEPSFGGSADNECELDECDREPSLGSVAMQPHESQAGWAAGNRRDLELASEDAPTTVSPRRLEAPSCGKPFSAPEFTRGTVEFRGTLHSQALAYKVTGDCLVPQVHDGDVIIVEPILPKQGELASIWPAGEGPIVKFVESDLNGWFPCKPGSELSLQVRLRMLNPPRVFLLDAAKIDRIWRVSQIVPAAQAQFHEPALTGFQPHA